LIYVISFRVKNPSYSIALDRLHALEAVRMAFYFALIACPSSVNTDELAKLRKFNTRKLFCSD